MSDGSSENVLGDVADGAVVITGAGGSIGTALAVTFGGLGLPLVLSDYDEFNMAMTGAQAMAAGATDVRTVTGDAGDPEVAATLVDACEDHGGPAVAVFNAGICVPGLTWEQPLEMWQRQVDVNYWGPVHGVRAVVPAMLARGSGHTFAVASGAGLVAPPGMGAYVSSKHAVVGLMESLHHELARVVAAGGGAGPVRASVVCPGNIATNIADNSLLSLNLEPDEVELAGVAADVDAASRAGVDAGASPQTVADAVLDAVRTGRFWVLPQPEVALGALDRYQRLADGGPPVDLLPPA
jgi:NAD(P)-dependent dehydrogenase (short-subunit alcohol dehydrogenase family)